MTALASARRFGFLWAAVVLLLAALTAALAVRSWTPATARFAEALAGFGVRPDAQQTLARLARIDTAGPGRVGVHALHLPTGRTIGLNDARPFPMASTYKVAIAAAYLDGVENGRLSLDRMFTVEEAHRVRSDGIAALLPHPGVALSAANLIELAIAISDNTASDLLLEAVGGPRVVTSWLRSNGISEMRIDRDTALQMLHTRGLTVEPGSTAAAALAARSPSDRRR
jgi:beta-lactamase class A